MASFDIIETSGKAYITAWTERSFLLSLMLVPFIIKAVFFGIVVLLEFQDNMFRMTLVMLPSYFMEGWMIAHITRFIFFGERWPVKLSGDTETDVAYIAQRGRAVFAAIILYTLLKMVQNGVSAPLLGNEEYLKNMSENNEATMAAFITAMAMGALIIWAFKFLFMHIALSVDISIKEYSAKLRGVTPSLYLLGAWLTCYIPVMICGFLLFNILAPVMTGSANVLLLGQLVIMTFADTAAVAVVTICFSIAFKQIFLGDPPKGS